MTAAYVRALDAAVLPHALREYALIADGERGALVGPRGEITWMCFPSWSDPAIFATLMGADGAFIVTPEARFVWGGYYEAGTLIWRSRWVTEQGVVECRDALARPAEAGRAVVLRQIHVLEGRHRIVLRLDVRHDFGASPMHNVRRDDALSWTATSGGVHLRWTVPAEATSTAQEVPGIGCVLEVESGSVHDLVLELSQHPLREPPATDRLWRDTENAWHSTRPSLDRSAAPRDAVHAAAVLTGLTTAGGGTVAAATTSLPERAQSGRSYDYRYVWLRDQAYIGQAAAKAGMLHLLDSSVTFVRDRLLDDGPRVMPAYTVSGNRVPDEQSVNVPGYPGGSATIGNHVNQQFQLDVFGEALLLFAAADELGRLDSAGWSAAAVAADAIGCRFGDADAGVWELSPKQWTHSRLLCVAGLQRMCRQHADAGSAERWRSLADRIIAEVAAHSLHGSGRWQRAPDDDRVDAALLLPAIRGAVPADDPRSVATLAAVEEDLTQDGYVYRYRPDERPLGEAEGAFLLCGFWLSMALSQQGRRLDAMRRFDRNRTACGPPGLLSEEFDVRQRQLRGNLPQAFVHAALLEAAVLLGSGE